MFVTFSCNLCFIVSMYPPSDFLDPTAGDLASEEIKSKKKGYQNILTN